MESGVLGIAVRKSCPGLRRCSLSIPRIPPVAPSNCQLCDIDSLLERIQKDTSDPLRREATIRDAFQLLLQGMDAHSAVAEAWAIKFRDSAETGSKWQELKS